MSSVIRKISIGSDYKNDAMHYSIGQEVWGGHIICDILSNDKSGEYSIYIKKKQYVETRFLLIVSVSDPTTTDDLVF